MIVFDQVTKKYGNGTVALDSVTYAVGAGEFVVIEGESGSGKTTLMRTIIRDIEIDSGKIVVDGDDIREIPKKNIPLLRRKVGVVFQDFKLLSDRTVAENIDLALDILGLDEKTAQTRRRELLELTGLLDKENDFPSQLSGGQLQRVAIARALAPQPKILFADEPTGNLDKKTAQAIIQLLHDINLQGTTVVMASHDTDLLKEFKLRRLRLDHGQMTQDSSAHHPRPHIEHGKSNKSDKVEADHEKT